MKPLHARFSSSMFLFVLTTQGRVCLVRVLREGWQIKYFLLSLHRMHKHLFWALRCCYSALVGSAAFLVGLTLAKVRLFMLKARLM